MKTLKFIHTADWHADSDPKKQEKLNASLDQLLNYVKENDVTAIIHAGDVWEKNQSYSDKSGVPLVVLYLKAISKYVDYIFITKGNNSHDEPGSISLLHQIEPNIIAYEYPVVLGIVKNDDYSILDLMRNEPDDFDEFQYIVSLVPYPTKSGFITTTSIDNNNADFLEKFEQIFELIGDITQPYSCPKILAFHGNVVGSRLSTGQTLVSQDIMVAPSTLEKAKHDYCALGHIHLRQEIKPWMKYSGSIYNKSWGETEQKSFEVIEYLDKEYTTDRIMFKAARPMEKIELEYKDGQFYTPDFENDHDGIPESINENAEHRLRIKVKENDRKLITAEVLNDLKFRYGDDAKIEFNIIPNERESRSEEIMHCKSLLDEVVEYSTVSNQDVSESAKQKVLSLQEEKVFS